MLCFCFTASWHSVTHFLESQKSWVTVGFWQLLYFLLQHVKKSNDKLFFYSQTIYFIDPSLCFQYQQLCGGFNGWRWEGQGKKVLYTVLMFYLLVCVYECVMLAIFIGRYNLHCLWFNGSRATLIFVCSYYVFRVGKQVVLGAILPFRYWRKDFSDNKKLNILSDTWKSQMACRPG